jgi:hypothetical protein
MAYCVAPQQALCRDPRSVPAGGALEVECARLLRAYGAKQAGLDQYAITQFAAALEIVPYLIAENSGESTRTSVFRCNGGQQWPTPLSWRIRGHASIRLSGLQELYGSLLASLPVLLEELGLGCRVQDS